MVKTLSIHPILVCIVRKNLFYNTLAFIGKNDKKQIVTNFKIDKL